MVSSFVLSSAAQDWYHEREERFRGDQWRPHLFMNVRTDLRGRVKTRGCGRDTKPCAVSVAREAEEASAWRIRFQSK